MKNWQKVPERELQSPHDGAGTSIEKKRQSPHDDENPQNDRAGKRQCTVSRRPGFSSINFAALDVADSKEAQERPNSDVVVRESLKRSIAIALKHVGFDSASKEAMESFTAAAETYLSTFIEELKKSAEAARRARPTPVDFAGALQQHNIPLSSLKPHLKVPVAKSKLEPEYYDPIPIPEHADHFGLPAMDFLGPELDGASEMMDKLWISDTLPRFPSKHTFMFTKVETPAPDPEKKRSQAAADARKSEMALRRIEKATKAREQKELRELAQRNPLSRARHDNWEDSMKLCLPNMGSSDEAQEIADHSVIVDYNAQFYRRHVPRESRLRVQ